jgi:hypothetical protein
MDTAYTYFHRPRWRLVDVAVTYTRKSFVFRQRRSGNMPPRRTTTPIMGTAQHPYMRSMEVLQAPSRWRARCQCWKLYVMAGNVMSGARIGMVFMPMSRKPPSYRTCSGASVFFAEAPGVPVFLIWRLMRAIKHCPNWQRIPADFASFIFCLMNSTAPL